MSAPKTAGRVTAQMPPRSSSDPVRELPFQVTDLKGVVRAKGITGSSISVPPGSYLIRAIAPDGCQWGSKELVTVSEGNEATVRLEPNDSVFETLPKGLEEMTYRELKKRENLEA